MNVVRYEKGDTFHLVHTEPLIESTTDHVDPNWDWTVRSRAHTSRDRKAADEVTPLLWRIARGMGLDRDVARRVVLRAASDSALRVRGRDTADVYAVLLGAVRREAAQLRTPATSIEGDPLATAPREYRAALTILAYGPEGIALRKNLEAQGNAALAWWRETQ